MSTGFRSSPYAYIKRYRALSIREADLRDIEEAEGFPLRESQYKAAYCGRRIVAYRRQRHITIEPLLV